jgi:hypothetical protein
MLIVESQSLDVYRNLAIEEYLMEHAVDQGPVLFLWQSGCAVVVGKNQNPWKECRLDRMRAEALERGANAIVGVRFTTSMVMQGSAEILVYGTGVVLATPD